jgi:CheY-like chemotaxis protein
MILLGKRVFIVEDNIANRAIEQLLLEQHGAKTAIERWGTDTVERLRAFMPTDVILLDLMFPDNITGYDIFDDIRAHTEFDHIPIVAVSASDPNSAIPLTKSRGFAGFISKPINMNLFTQQIFSIINQESVWYRR